MPPVWTDLTEKKNGLRTEQWRIQDLPDSDNLLFWPFPPNCMELKKMAGGGGVSLLPLGSIIAELHRISWIYPHLHILSELFERSERLNCLSKN